MRVPICMKYITRVTAGDIPYHAIPLQARCDITSQGLDAHVRTSLSSC